MWYLLTVNHMWY